MKAGPLFYSAMAHLVPILLLALPHSEAPRSGLVSVLQIELGGHPGEQTGQPRPASRPRSLRKATRRPPALNPSAETEASEALAAEPAESGPGDATGENPQAGGTGASAGELSQYIATVVNMINASKRYPRSALLREEEGEVMVSIDVASDGTISNPRIEKPSRFESLNLGALETIRSLGKLPPTPPSMPNGAHLHIPILFQLRAP